jgi:hypothetical protein
MPSEDPLEIYAFSLTEKKSCRQVEEHKIYSITEEENKKLEDEAEKLLKELKIEVRSRKELPDNFNFSVVRREFFIDYSRLFSLANCD